LILGRENSVSVIFKHGPIICLKILRSQHIFDSSPG
jgi:hypothetical protein